MGLVCPRCVRLCGEPLQCRVRGGLVRNEESDGNQAIDDFFYANALLLYVS